jgi:L-aminopeptidase/D-esterase-like protein
MMEGVRPGPRNLITDVEGIAVGNAEDPRILTGTTVVVPDGQMVVAADIRGGAPGSRETPALEAENLVETFHAIVLSGGSVFGLDAASAVTTELARRGKGSRLRPRGLALPGGSSRDPVRPDEWRRQGLGR